jgi:hypothetical protein
VARVPAAGGAAGDGTINGIPDPRLGVQFCGRNGAKFEPFSRTLPQLSREVRILDSSICSSNPNNHGPSAQLPYQRVFEKLQFSEHRLWHSHVLWNQRVDVGGQGRVYERGFWGFLGLKTTRCTVPTLTLNLRAISRIDIPPRRISTARPRSNIFFGLPTGRFIPLWL